MQAHYFATPIAGSSRRAARERIFCYELYHQLRATFERESFNFMLGGELDKAGHPIIRDGMVPDLVVHHPGDMERNLCVIEVKPVAGRKTGFRKDVVNLLRFVTEYSYREGILLIFGRHRRGQSLIRGRLGAEIQELRRAHVRVLWMESAGEPPVEFS